MRAFADDNAGLIETARSGDTDALNSLIRENWDLAWRTAAAVTGSRQLAEDAAQEAFVKVTRSLPRFDGRSRFSTWLTRIVVNCAIDAVRRQRRSDNPPPEAATPDWADFEIPDPTVGHAIRALSEERRTVVVLRYWVEMTNAEIAEVLDLPLGTVNSRLSRALDELRVALGEES